MGIKRNVKQGSQMTLKQFNRKYIYKSDKERFNISLDIWELPKDADIVYADCESYCRFLKSNIKEFKDYEYYYCKLNGTGHCILYKKGNVIDCNIKSVVSLDYYLRIYDMTELKKYNWFVVFSKIAFAKGYLWIKSFKN